MTGCFRQALAMIREALELCSLATNGTQERLYSAMYIAGTALAIAFTMLIAEVYYVKVADIAPEVHRSRKVYLQGMVKRAVQDTLRWQQESRDEHHRGVEG